MSGTRYLALLLVVLGLTSIPLYTAPARSLDAPHHPLSADPAASLSLESQAYRASVAELRRLIQVDPDDAELRIALGLALEEIGDLAGAVSEYREALRRRPEHALAFYHLSRARRAERARSESRIAQDSVVVDREQLVRSHASRGSTLLAEGKHATAAMAFREALQLDPSDVQSRLLLGQTLFAMGDVGGAIGAYHSLLAGNPDHAQGRLQLAVALMIREEWADARTQLEAAIRVDPALTEGHFQLGIVRYTLGDHAGAIAAYRQALVLDPDFADAHYHLGLSLMLMNQETAAAQEFLLAARAGLPQAQYFLGSAYLNGFGVARDRSTTLEWWFRASEQGMGRAREGLALLRRDALLEKERPAERAQGWWMAFGEYRAKLWDEFPELIPEGPGEELGSRLLRVGRAQDAVPVLIREAEALSDEAPVLLETLYEEGTAGLAPFDRRILAYWEMSAAEGLPRSRLALARVYGLGLGVEPNVMKAKTLLGDHPGPAASSLLKTIDADLDESSLSTRLRVPRADR